MLLQWPLRCSRNSKCMFGFELVEVGVVSRAKITVAVYYELYHPCAHCRRCDAGNSVIKGCSDLSTALAIGEKVPEN